MEYIEIKEQIKQKLPVARDLGDSENLLELGLSSLTIMRLVNQWRKQGVKVSFGSLMENPTLEGWWALIQRSMKKKAGKKRAQESKITPEKDMKQPFPLTDVQYAYWVGRDEEQALGGIDCHAYLEFDGGNIDPERLEKAWNVLQYHHPMLRACFLEDGTQKILDKPYCEKIKVHDFSRMPSEEAEAMAVSVRERLSHRKLKIEEGEVAGIELTLFPENRARMHVDMALLVADVQSLQILLRDLAAAYRGESLPAESKGWNFASYLERQKEEDKEERNNAEGYWKKTLGAFAERARPATGKTAAGSDKDCIQPQDCKDWQGRVGSSASTGKGIPDNSGNGSSYCICDGFGTVEQESSFPY